MMDEQTAARLARLALNCVTREYPNKIAHVMQSDEDVRAPRELTPAFYGCFDWHSAVHGHWMLARLARLFPEAGFAQEARAALERNLTPPNILAEVRYLTAPGRDSFERPYGLAWLLALSAELPGALDPLADAAWNKLEKWIRKLPYPDRSGQHANTAFALGLIIDCLNHDRLADRSALPWFEAAARFYEKDRDAPVHLEPSGEDFLSPSLAEADLMRRLYAPEKFALWLNRFLPALPDFEPEVSPDPADGKLAHLDGLNLSRAWMLRGIAQGLPAKDSRRKPLLQMAEAHRAAGLKAVTGEHVFSNYAGGHWLGTFAVYLETK